MRIKLDENIPARLVPLLMDLGHDVDTVIGEKLVGRDDPASSLTVSSLSP